MIKYIIIDLTRMLHFFEIFYQNNLTGSNCMDKLFKILTIKYISKMKKNQ